MLKKFAVITGASNGMGLELAKEFARNQYDLLIAGPDDEINLAGEELSDLGASVYALRVDLAFNRGVDDLFRAVRSARRPVDALVLSASGSGGLGGHTTVSDELRLIALNITSVVHFAKHVLPSMIAYKQGRVILTSSTAALMPGTYGATYAATQAFLLSYAEGLQHELRDTGVTVNTLMAGDDRMVADLVKNKLHEFTSRLLSDQNRPSH